MARAQEQAQPGANLQNAAAPQKETFNDWTVACATDQGRRSCVMSQHQRKADSGQLVLAAEFTALSDTQMRGALVLPFGLRLADGVALRVDDGAAEVRLPFSTCLPAGCIVPVDLGPQMIRSLRAGRVLSLAATAADSGQAVRLAVSLKGFSAAQDRALVLGQTG